MACCIIQNNVLLTCGLCQILYKLAMNLQRDTDMSGCLKIERGDKYSDIATRRFFSWARYRVNIRKGRGDGIRINLTYLISTDVQKS